MNGPSIQKKIILNAGKLAQTCFSQNWSMTANHRQMSCENRKPITWEPNSENCLDLIFVPSPCEKDIIVSDTNFITSAIRKFMLDIPSSGSFQDIGL